MKIKLFYIAFFISLFFSFCSTTKWNNSDRWEGIKKNKLRVYLKEELDDDIYDNKKTEDKNKQVSYFELGNQRAFIILASYARIQLYNLKNVNKVKSLILDSIKTGKIVYEKYSDDYYEIYIDYQIQQYLNYIHKQALNKKK